MRNGQNKHHRMRGRNRGGSGGGGGGGGKNHNPLTRVYESNGPDVKIRGTANHVAEKYIQLARDAASSGDPVAAENYYQHAEHYFRLIAAAQEQFRQNPPYQQQPQQGGGNPSSDDNFDGDEDGIVQPQSGGGEPHSPRDHQQRDFNNNNNNNNQQRHQNHNNQPRHDRQDRQDHQPRFDNRPAQQNGGPEGDVSSLPSFITGGQPQQNAGSNGHESQGDRFPRRRRRHHRDTQGGAQGSEGPDDNAQPDQGPTQQPE